MACSTTHLGQFCVTLHEAHDKLGYELTKWAPIDIEKILAAAVQGLLCVMHHLMAFISRTKPIGGFAVHVELMMADVSIGHGMKALDDAVVMVVVVRAVERLVEEDLMEGLVRAGTGGVVGGDDLEAVGAVVVEGLLQNVAVGWRVLQVLVAVHQTVDEVDQLVDIETLSVIFKSQQKS